MYTTMYKSWTNSLNNYKITTTGLQRKYSNLLDRVLNISTTEWLSRFKYCIVEIYINGFEIIC